MLFIIDMQNKYVDKHKGENYINDSEKLVESIIKKIKESEQKGEYIFYTVDITIRKETFRVNNNNQKISNDTKSINIQEMKSDKIEEWNCREYEPLSLYLDKHEKIKKAYYAIPPEMLLSIQKRFKDEKYNIEEIEFVGVETNVCVLANAICLQSMFPQAKIVIHEDLCKSTNIKDHEAALNIMKSLGMEIRSENNETR